VTLDESVEGTSAWIFTIVMAKTTLADSREMPNLHRIQQCASASKSGRRESRRLSRSGHGDRRRKATIPPGCAGSLRRSPGSLCPSLSRLCRFQPAAIVRQWGPVSQSLALLGKRRRQRRGKSDWQSKGHGFESRRARHEPITMVMIGPFRESAGTSVVHLGEPVCSYLAALLPPTCRLEKSSSMVRPECSAVRGGP
jgi:hypothetical protein